MGFGIYSQCVFFFVHLFSVIFVFELYCLDNVTLWLNIRS